jgi:hypothetical protein
MLLKGTIELRGADIYEAIASAQLDTVVKASKEDRSAALERSLTDIRVCSFLSYTEDGFLRFAHKSYFEFFVAQACVLACQNGPQALSEFSQRPLGKEIMYFLGSFARDQEQFRAIVIAIIKGGDRVNYRGLACRIAFASGTGLSRLSLVNDTINDVELRKANVDSVFFNNCSFESVLMSELQASHWVFDNCAIKHMTIHSSEFSGATMKVEGNGLECQRTKFIDSELNLSGTDWAILDSKVERTKFTYGGIGLLLAARFDDCRITPQANLMLRSRSRIAFRQSVVTGKTNDEKWYEDGAVLQFYSCLLAGVRIEASDIFALVSNTIHNVDKHVTFHGCRGVVLVLGYQRDYAVKLQPLFPEIAFYDLRTVKDALSATRRESSRKSNAPPNTVERSRKRHQAGRELLLSISNSIRLYGLQNHLHGVLADVLTKTRAAGA